MAERFLNIVEVAERLNVKRTAIYAFIQGRDFPLGFKFGRGRRWRESDINSWIDKQAVTKRSGSKQPQAQAEGADA